VTSALTTWATNLKIDVTHLVSDQERKRAVRNAIGQRRMLIVMDDVWQPEAADLLRCGGPNCCHLLTTRDRRIARSFASAAGSQSVPPLKMVPAFKLLKSLAPEACAVDPRAALGLTQAVGGLPLALELLGGYLAAPEGNRFTNLSQQALAELADPKRRLRLAQRRLGGGGQIETLEEIIKLSLEGLQETEEGQAAVQAFYALGAFAPKPARFSVAAAEAVTGAWLFILGLLGSRNLVEVSVEGELSLHQTLAEVARTKVEESAIELHRQYYLALVSVDQEDWQRIAEVYEQLQWAWQQAPEDERRFALIYAMWTYQNRQGLWNDYMGWIRRGLEIAQRTEDLEQIASMFMHLGYIHDSLEQWPEALENYNQALTIWEEEGEWPGLTKSLTNIGLVYDSLGQVEEALDYFNRALPIQEEVEDRYGESITRWLLGLLYQQEEDLTEAVTHLTRAVELAAFVKSPYRNQIQLALTQVEKQVKKKDREEWLQRLLGRAP
jgi:tetratricopeptide (TPR) repeat protein